MTEYETRVREILQAIREKASGAELDPSEQGTWLQDRKVELVRELAREGRRTGEAVEKLTAQWEKELSAEEFWEDVREGVRSELLPYRQTAFLREKPEEEQAALLRDLFEQGVRYQEQRSWLKERLELTDEQIIILLRTYNTMIRWVVGNRMSRRYFRVRSQEAFGFSEALADQLWERLDEDRAILAERFVYQAMIEQRQQMKQLREAVMEFLSFWDDLDEEEEDEE